MTGMMFKDGFKYLVEHGFSQAFGLRIVATAMIAVIQLQAIRQFAPRVIGGLSVLQLENKHR